MAATKLKKLGMKRYSVGISPELDLSFDIEVQATSPRQAIKAVRKLARKELQAYLLDLTRNLARSKSHITRAEFHAHDMDADMNSNLPFSVAQNRTSDNTQYHNI